MVWPCGVRREMVGKVAVWATSIPESVGCVVDVVEVRGGCPWRCGGRDWKPWRSLLEALTVCE